MSGDGTVAVVYRSTTEAIFFDYTTSWAERGTKLSLTTDSLSGGICLGNDGSDVYIANITTSYPDSEFRHYTLSGTWSLTQTMAVTGSYPGNALSISADDGEIIYGIRRQANYGSNDHGGFGMMIQDYDWQAVPLSEDNAEPVWLRESTFVPDGTVTTQLLGSGTFGSGRYNPTSAPSNEDWTHVSANTTTETEYEYTIYLNYNQLAVNDTLRFTHDPVRKPILSYTVGPPVITVTAVAPKMTHYGYRFRLDNQSQTLATWMDTTNSSELALVKQDDPFRIRFSLNSYVGSPASTAIGYTLKYRQLTNATFAAGIESAAAGYDISCSISGDGTTLVFGDQFRTVT